MVLFTININLDMLYDRLTCIRLNRFNILFDYCVLTMYTIIMIKLYYRLLYFIVTF